VDWNPGNGENTQKLRPKLGTDASASNPDCPVHRHLINRLPTHWLVLILDVYNLIFTPVALGTHLF
jgi:hypothetical protein